MSNFENYKNESLKKILTNSYISEFIKNNKLTNDFVYDNFNIFNDCLESIEQCENCKGLKDCKQRKKGEFVGLENNGFVTNNIIYCKYQEEKENIENHLSSFAYNDIPNNLHDLTLKDVKSDEDAYNGLVFKAIEIFKGNSKKGLYIYGDMGVGKTYISIALANSLVINGETVAFIKVNDFVTKMAYLIREDVNEYDQLVNKIKKVKYLFLDDIGSEAVSEFTRDRLLFNILDYRMENKLTTIFTSNLDKKSLLKQYSINNEAVKANRIYERIDILSDDYCLNGTNKRRNG